MSSIITKQQAKAIRVGIKAIKEQLKSVAVDANLAELCGATYPAAKAASKKRTELLTAREELERML